MIIEITNKDGSKRVCQTHKGDTLPDSTEVLSFNRATLELERSKYETEIEG